MTSVCMTPLLSIACPHCQGHIVVVEKDVKCGIFRHAVYRCSGEPVPPHAPKAVCEQLVADAKVFGCAKPFRLVQVGDGCWRAVKCAYV